MRRKGQKMSQITNHARAQLKNGQLSLGANVRLARTPDIVRILKVAGFDWLWCDRELTDLPLDIASQIALCAIDNGITPLMRISQHSAEEVNLVLTCGFMGVIIPHVDTAEQARPLVRATRFLPKGDRAAPNVYLHFGYQPISHQHAANILNEHTMCVVLLESRQAIRNADEIAAVEGVDVLWVGASDLSFDLGIPGESAHPMIEDACKTVIAAAQKNGKYAGVGGVSDNDALKKYIKYGIRFISSGVDSGFLANGAKNRVDWLRGTLSN